MTKRCFTDYYDSCLVQNLQNLSLNHHTKRPKCITTAPPLGLSCSFVNMLLKNCQDEATILNVLLSVDAARAEVEAHLFDCILEAMKDKNHIFLNCLKAVYEDEIKSPLLKDTAIEYLAKWEHDAQLIRWMIDYINIRADPAALRQLANLANSHMNSEIVTTLISMQACSI